MSIALFYVLFVCKCVLYYCHRVSTQLQLNISYHIISYLIISYHIMYLTICTPNSDLAPCLPVRQNCIIRGAWGCLHMNWLYFLNFAVIPSSNVWVPCIVTLARKAVSHRTKNGYCCLCSYSRACLTASGTCSEQPHVLSALLLARLNVASIHTQIDQLKQA